MSEIKNYIRENRSQEVDSLLNDLVNELEDKGFSVEFGKIGIRTTYAMIYDENHDTEIVGYTFLRDMKYYKENVGRLKALQQAIARKEIADKEGK